MCYQPLVLWGIQLYRVDQVVHWVRQVLEVQEVPHLQERQDHHPLHLIPKKKA